MLKKLRQFMLNKNLKHEYNIVDVSFNKLGRFYPHKNLQTLY